MDLTCFEPLAKAQVARFESFAFPLLDPSIIIKRNSMWIDFLFLGVAVLFLMGSLSALYHSRWVRRLPQLNTADSFPDRKSVQAQCSVIIAVRNEESRIEETLKRLLAQQNVDLNIIVVNDRSTDRTAEILTRIAGNEPRLKIETITELPMNWLGKSHACYRGAMQATGEWILFTDADCWMKPDVIARALCIARRTSADHVTMTPGVAPETWPARGWHLFFLISIADWISRVNRDRPKAFVGIGAFNLVQTSAYKECGGHEALRMEVLDDVKLGCLLRRSGKRTRGFIGGDDVQCDWGVTVRSMIKIMEKNYFAAMNFKTWPALTLSVGGTLIWLIAVGGIFSGTGSGAVATLGLFSMAVPATVFARRLGWSSWSGLIVPFIFPAMFFAVFNSTVRTLRQGGIFWREHFYPLDQLRKGNVKL